MSCFSAIQQKEEQVLCRGYARYPLAIEKGHGNYLWDCEGKKYLDLIAGIAVVGLGHCNEELAETMEKQARKLIHVSNLFYQEEQLELAEKLLGTAHFGKAFFCNSGAEANEAAIKLARRYSQRVKNNGAYEIITFNMCFHGRTLATIAATGERIQDGFAPIPEGFKQIPWGDLDLVREAISDKTAGILIEAIQGEGGVRAVTPEFIQGIAALCKEKDILLLMDEVQCGLGRTGKWWGFQHFGVQPDIISIAKGLANGLPMGAMMATEEVAKGFVTGSHATTFGGGAFVSAVAAKTLEIIERDKRYENAATVGAWAIERFTAIGKKFPGAIKEVRGLGLIIGIDMAQPAKAIWQECINRGVIVNLTQETVLRLIPSLTVTQDELEHFAQTFEAILADGIR